MTFGKGQNISAAKETYPRLKPVDVVHPAEYGREPLMESESQPKLTMKEAVKNAVMHKLRMGK